MYKMDGYKRTYCEIDLDAIRHNVIEAKKKADGAMLMAVIKADGYGHGALQIGHYIKDVADYFATATIEEAIELRESGLDNPILILGYNSPSLFEKNLEYDVDQTIYSYEDARAMSEAAVKLGKTGKIHLALDTGMTRIGLSPDEEGLELAKKISGLPGLEMTGLFTHFSCADMTDKTYTFEQMERYDRFSDMLEKEKIRIKYRHICNSAAIMEFDHHRYDMVRSGIINYGLYPSDKVDQSTLKLIPALAWKAHVVHVNEPAQGMGVSYGATYRVDGPMRLATVSIGYADGYSRQLSNRGWVLIHGQKAPICGRVCMDQMMVDVTHIPDVKVEDVVTLIGSDGEERISVEEMAELAGSFNYEFVCDIGQRVPRIFKGVNLK